jgi:hypothetical protein
MGVNFELMFLVLATDNELEFSSLFFTDDLLKVAPEAMVGYL